MTLQFKKTMRMKPRISGPERTEDTGGFKEEAANAATSPPGEDAMKSRIALSLLLAVCLPVALHAQGAGQAPVAVYVSAPMKDGFVDTNKGIQDSVKDVQRRLSGMKEFRLVESREKADITVTVLMRGVGSEAYGQRLNYTEYSGSYYKNAQLTNTPMVAQTLWVSAVMEVGAYRKEFTGTALNVPGQRWGRWSECDAQIILQRISGRGRLPTGSR